MSDTRRAQDAMLEEQIRVERRRGRTSWWRDYLAHAGRARVLDHWVACDVSLALREINLNRWRGDAEVAAAAREARAAADRLRRAISTAEKIR